MADSKKLLEDIIEYNSVEAFVWNCQSPQPKPDIWLKSIASFPQASAYLELPFDPDPNSSELCVDLIQAIGPKYWHCYWRAYIQAVYIEEHYRCRCDPEDGCECVPPYARDLLDWHRFATGFVAAVDQYDERVERVNKHRKDMLCLKRPASSMDE